MRFFAIASTIVSSLALVSAAAAPSPQTEFGTIVARHVILDSRSPQNTNATLATRQLSSDDQSCLVDCSTKAVKSNTSAAAACATATTQTELQQCICKNKSLISDIGSCVKSECPSVSSLVSQLCTGVDTSSTGSSSGSSSGYGSSGSDAGVKLTSGGALTIAAGAAFIAFVM